VEEADVLLWCPAPSTLFLGGWPTTTVPLYAGTAKAGLLPIGVAWMVRSLLLLSSCSARKHTKQTWMWSLPSREIDREEVFWSLAVLAVVLLMRRLLMRVFSAGLRSSFHPWAKAGPLKGPRSRWTGIPRYLEHRHLPPQDKNNLLSLTLQGPTQKVVKKVRIILVLSCRQKQLPCVVCVANLAIMRLRVALHWVIGRE
jgi:hypothetical protein